MIRRNSKLRVAWFSVLTESDPESLSAYVSAALLPLLGARFEIELFHAHFWKAEGFPTYHYLTALERHARQPFDLFFYQLEDRSSANFVRSHIGLMPGVTLMHDLLYLDLGPEPLLNSPWQSVVEKFNHPGVNWPARSAKFPRSGPIAVREAAFAAAPLFSSIRNLQEFNSHVDVRLRGSLPPAFLPLPVETKIYKPRKFESVSRIGCCGSPRIEGRMHKLLEALGSSNADFDLYWLVADNEIEQARALVSESGFKRCEILGGRNPVRWTEVTARCDLTVHTLFSAYGKSGPYLEISLMRGLPVIVSSFGHTDHISDEVVFKIEPGDSEAVQIRLLLERLKTSGSAIDTSQIHRYARELHDRRAVAGELESVLVSASRQLAGMYERWAALKSSAHAALLGEISDRANGEDLFQVAGGSWHNLAEPSFAELDWLK